MIVLVLSILCISHKQIDDRPIILDGATDPYASQFIFVATDFGVFSFNRNTETWDRITQTKSQIIGLNEGILWNGSEEGLGSADVRINDWRTYDIPGFIQGLDFDDNYVWIGNDSGLSRFDKFQETWVKVSSLKITHLLLEKKYLWLATDSGVFRFNQEFEKIEPVPAPKISYYYIINTPNRIWFLAESLLIAYEKNTENWSNYPAMEISDYSNLGDSLFVVSNNQVYIFEPKANSWLEFRDVPEVTKVNGILVNSNNILLSQDNGLLVYNRAEKSRKIYNRTNGLENDSLIDVFEDSKYIIGLSRYDWQILNKETGIWQTEKITPAKPKSENIFSLDEAGVHAKLLKDVDIILSGRAYYSESRTFSDLTRTRTDQENINLNLSGLHKTGRSFSLYYDDMDKDQILYGLGYRGLNKDVLYNANAGFLKSGYYEFDLVPQFSILGGNAKFRFDRQRADLQAGRVQSMLRNDFFFGRSFEKKISLKDINYSKNTFYYIYDEPRPIIKETDTIFVDDRNASTNQIDTRTNYTIAGITGDFDPLINGIDYFIDYANGIIHFRSLRNNSDIIVLVLNGEAIIIQSDEAQNHQAENSYFVGPNILPNSFSLTIFDTLGQIYPLSDFGLDEDNDEQIDAKFINHDLGFLSFPQPRPFPDVVYDDTISIYNLNIQFLTRSTFYYLSFHPILKGSEKIYVDGELMGRGADYVIDYTSGTLIFLTEDIISDFSEIEVQYSSVERENKTIFYSAQPNFSIGKGINLAPGISVIDTTKVLHVSGKLETGAKDQKSIKFIPQAAIDANQAWAHKYSLIGNYEILSVNAEYSGYAQDFSGFGANEKKYGRLQHSGNISARIEPLNHLSLDAQFKKEYQIDSMNVQQPVQYTQGKISYLNPKYPNGYVLLGKDFLPDYEKNRFQINANYDFQLLRTAIKLNSVVRTGLVGLKDNNQDKLFEYIIKSSFSLPVPVRGAINFQYNDLAGNNTRKQNDNELRATLNFDWIPGIYYTGNYNLQTASYYFSNSQNLNLQHYFYSNLNIAPGRWYSKLSIINLSFGLGNNFDEYVSNLASSYQKPLVIFNPIQIGSIEEIYKANNYYATVQFMPYSNLVISVKPSLIRSANSYYRVPDLIPTIRNEIRVEFEPGNLGIFISSWDHRQVKTYPIETIDNVYLEWSKPWSALVRTKWTNNFRITEDNYGTIATTISGIKTNLETLLRFNSKSFVTINLGAERQKDYLNEVDYSIIPGAGFNLNLFSFLYLQTDYQLTYILGGTATHFLSSKITGQF